MKKLKSDFSISSKYNITLANLGRKGCADYIFNEAARARVSDLLEVMSTRCKPNQEFLLDQSLVGTWLTTELKLVGEQSLQKPKTPLQIAASYPSLHKVLIADISRQFDAGTP